MKVFVATLLIGVWAVTPAWAVKPGTIYLKCQLTNSTPRNPPHGPTPPFTQHFRVDLTARTVDGHKATISDTTIGWEPHERYLGPYATLSRPDWHFHSERQIGHVHNEVAGPCVPVP